jgi:transposase-like protein
MTDNAEKKSNDCMMKCPDCSHEMNVCRTRIRSTGDPVCPGCGATLVPITESEKKS